MKTAAVLIRSRLCIVVLAGVLGPAGVVMVAASGAHAALPKRGAMYGGGTTPLRVVGHGVALRVSQNGAALALVMNLWDSGSGQAEQFKVRRRGIRLKRDGSFSASGTYSYLGYTYPGGLVRSPSDRISGTYSVRGRFVSVDEAVGTATARWSRRPRRGAPVRGDTGQVHFRVNAPTLGLGSGALLPGASYRGFLTHTSRALPEVRLPLALRVSADGKSVISLHAGLRAYRSDCRGARSVPSELSQDWGGRVSIPIRNNRFSLHDDESGLDMTGVFGPTYVHGTVSLEHPGLEHCVVTARWYASR